MPRIEAVLLLSQQQLPPPCQPSSAAALHAEIGNAFPRVQFDTKSGSLTVERTADGYAMQLPLLAPTDELPGVAGLPEVRRCTPTGCPVFLPSGKEAVHATLVTELYQSGHAGKRAAPIGCLLFTALERSAASAARLKCCGWPQPHTTCSAPSPCNVTCAPSLQLQYLLLES